MILQSRALLNIYLRVTTVLLTEPVPRDQASPLVYVREFMTGLYSYKYVYVCVLSYLFA